jgi:hypothetical protein
MQSSIKIEHFWQIQSELIIGLNIQSNDRFPIVVGCSLRTNSGEIADIPARYLSSPGLSFWGVETVNSRFKYPPNSGFDGGWKGQIIFALYSDATFSKRIADTGWVNWYSNNLFMSSTAGLDARDEEIDWIIKNTYKGRTNEVWKALDGKTTINVFKRD